MSFQQNINIINIDIIQPSSTKLAQICLDKSIILKDRYIGQKYSSTNNPTQRQHSKTLNGYQSVKVVSTIQNITIKANKENKIQTPINKEQVQYKKSPSRAQPGLKPKYSSNLISLLPSTNKSSLQDSYIQPNSSPQHRDHILTDVSDSLPSRTRHVGTRTSSRQISVYKPRCMNSSISHHNTPLNKSPLKNISNTFQINNNKGSMDSSVSLTPKIQPNQQQVSNIRIFVRVRPTNKFETDLNLNQQGENSLQILNDQKISIPNERMIFTFTKVFHGDNSQDMVFNDIGKDTVKEVTIGYNGTIIAYGPTGSGKTHSMFGSLDNVEEQGLIPRACKQIFEHIQNQSDQKYTIYCEMMEIYQESLNDLLSSDRQELKIKESPQEGVYVKGLTRILIHNESELMEAVCLGNNTKKINSTKINEYSSRSHTLLTIEIISRPCDNDIESKMMKKRGRLNLVDLAGSEKVAKSGAVGITLDEARKINLSLSCLGNVIHAISNNNEHIPYRDSKLTRILQESIGGNYKTSMLVTCSPHSSSINETMTTLKFAVRAKSVKNYCKLNFKPFGDSMKNIVSQLSQELAQTKTELSNFKLALIRIKEHIQGQNQDHSMSYDRAKETVKVLDELIKRQSNQQDSQKTIDQKHDFNEVKENLTERFPQVIGENYEQNENLSSLKGGNTQLVTINNTLDSMVPLLIQNTVKEKKQGQIGQLKMCIDQKDQIINMLEKQIQEERLQKFDVQRENVQLKDAIEQLLIKQSRSQISKEFSQVQVQILSNQLQASLEQVAKQELIISNLNSEKKDIVNKSFEQLLKSELHFSEIKLTDYFRISVNPNTNILSLYLKYQNFGCQTLRMSLDDQPQFTIDPTLKTYNINEM